MKQEDVENNLMFMWHLATHRGKRQENLLTRSTGTIMLFILARASLHDGCYVRAIMGFAVEAGHVRDLARSPVNPARKVDKVVCGI